MNEVIRVDTSELEALGRKFADAKTIVGSKLRGLLHESVLHLEGDVAERTPVGATRYLRGSIFGELRGTGVSLTGIVATPTGYAAPVELGTRPHFPPVAPLVYWADRKLGDGRLGFAVAKAIARRGTKGRFMFRDALEAFKPKLKAKVESLPGKIMDEIR